MIGKTLIKQYIIALCIFFCAQILHAHEGKRYNHAIKQQIIKKIIETFSEKNRTLLKKLLETKKAESGDFFASMAIGIPIGFFGCLGLALGCASCYVGGHMLYNFFTDENFREDSCGTCFKKSNSLF